MAVVERIAVLEQQQKNTAELTQRLVESQDNIAQSLQELVSIHREGVVRQESDRRTIEHNTREIEGLWRSHRKLHKVVWSYIWIGSGIFLTFGFFWKAGLIPSLIGALSKQ